MYPTPREPHSTQYPVRCLSYAGCLRRYRFFSALLRSLAKISLLIIDDWMRDPITLSNAQDILEVLDDRFGHTATLIASQVPVSDWHLRIPDPTLADAILDRLVHNAQRIELKGESQRKLRAGRSMPNT